MTIDDECVKTAKTKDRVPLKWKVVGEDMGRTVGCNAAQHGKFIFKNNEAKPTTVESKHPGAQKFWKPTGFWNARYPPDRAV